MPSGTICKTVRQYSRFPVTASDMGKLLEIASDYCKVKNYVYDRYGGIGGLAKIYPGYTVQNELGRSGFREELRLPSVYFYLAIFEALGEIKSQWSRTKTKVSELVKNNKCFSEEEKHYLRFLLKAGNGFEAILNQRTPKYPEDISRQYDRLSEAVDTDRLNRYLCRQVRKYHVRPHTDKASGFSASERAYRYGCQEGQQGIYISTKEKRKRVFVALTDNNQYRRQIYIKLYPQEMKIEIDVPINVTVHKHEDYIHETGLSLGFFTMLTTDQGHVYGGKLGDCQTEYADWIRSQQSGYDRNREANPGRKKYEARKRRKIGQLHSYINQELNRFLREEKPGTVYIVKLPGKHSGGAAGRINHCISLWQRGYIRKRLKLKCREHSVELVEVLGKDISNECSACGAIGYKEAGYFICRTCGYRDGEKTNTARNVLKRGRSGKIVC